MAHAQTVRASKLAAPLVGLLLSAACTAEPPPVYGQLGEFSLTDQLGRPFGSKELSGKVWVANFIFTRCQTVCPAFSARMAMVQKGALGLGPDLHLVSFSVDPEYDTPARLEAYGARYGALTERWSFLTGPLDAVKALVTDGLKISMGKDPRVDDEVAAIFHGTHFVLMDRQLQIRGYVDNREVTSVQEVLRGARQLLDQGP